MGICWWGVGADKNNLAYFGHVWENWVSVA